MPPPWKKADPGSSPDAGPLRHLSDEQLRFTNALKLPTFEADGMTLLKRCTLIVDDGRVTHVFYPVFPPDRNAGDVIAWLSTFPGQHRENRS